MMDPRAPRSLGLFLGAALGACALVVACSSSDSGAGAEEDGGVGAGGFAETGTSSGDGATSGSSEGGSANDAAAVETACDPAKSDCKPGEVCTDIGRSSPVCRRPCKGDAECTTSPKSACVILTAGSPQTGACIPTCKLYGTDCGPTFTCSRVPEQANVTQTTHAMFCKKAGATPLGGACVNDPASCGANADCIFFQDKGEGVNDSKCHTLCEPTTHPCGAGKGDCYTMSGDAFGFCHDG